MTGFTDATEICNRALTRVGARRIAAGLLTTENSKEADECNSCYDKLRRAELRRNVWRFSIRRAVLRAVGTALPDWDSAVTYGVGAYVTYNDVNYVALLGTNTNQNPATATSYWAVFNGNTSQKVTFSAWAIATTYGQGAIVTGTDDLLYLSMSGSNTGNDPTTDDGTYWTLYFGSTVASAWDDDTSYSIGELVFDVANTVYASTMNSNGNDPTGGVGWVTIGGTAAPIVIPWPAGTGPGSDPTSRNVFVLPNGYLRQAPSDPRAGEVSVLGFPSNNIQDDWLFEGGYIISRDTGPIMLRFAADVTQVPLMDDMFCEGLAARIALEVCEPLTQSSTKLKDIASEYKQFMGDARRVNGIETSATSPPLDDFIACRG